MEIQEMRATFGKLQDQTLSLKPGLNCIYAPNESGKSTWSHFLRIMLYGLSTRERGDLADKNRFAPWSGAAMRGQLQVADGNGTSLTLSRGTRRANAPMGQFACTYTGTATAVPGIDGQNAGETLLGVPREVFERSAFIRQSALAVDSDAELERRIAALITTGEEDVSYTEVQERLKKQLNRRRSNRANGQIPALEREIAELESQQAHRDDLTRQAAAAQQQLDSLTRQAEELQAQQALWQQQKQTERLRQYRQAQQDAEEAERKAAWLLAESADALPEDSLLNRLEGQCAALQESQAGLRQAQTAAQQAKAEADDAAARCAAHPLSPNDEAACRAKLDAITAPAVPSPLLTIVGILLTICGGMGAVFHSTTLQLCLLIALALSGIGLTASSLLRRKNAIAAQAQADAARAALTAQLADYLPLLRQQQEAARRSQEAAATAAGLAAAQQQQLLTLLSALQPYAPTAADLGGAQMALLHLRQQRTALSAARQAARDAAMRRDLLKQQLPESMPNTDDTPLPRPTISQEALAEQLPRITQLQQSARSRLDTLTGQLRALGSAGDIDVQLQQRRQQLQQLQGEYDAIALAMTVLDEANTTLQNRFSPALGARAAEIFSKITAGRYQKVLLSRDLSLETDSEGAQRSVQLLSQGAADQLYLAVRLAICDLVLPEDKSVPLILDDALLTFDDDRLHAALDYLLEESEKRQILLFTCQKREGAYLSGHKNVTLLAI